MDELVSIIMPSYNTGKYIAESINSVLAQTYTNWELIIVDDCSSDNTEEVVQSFKDNRIIYLKNENNSGAALSRNRALREAKGKWIAFLDSDDLWMPDKLRQQINFMKENDYSFSYTEYERIDELSNKLNIYCTGPRVLTKKRMYQYCYPGCLTVMFDYSKTGLIQIKNIKKNNDYAMWLQVIKFCDCHLLKQNLALYRIRKNSISHDSIKKLIKSHYDLFRISEEKNSLVAFLYVIRNMWFGFWKKRK